MEFKKTACPRNCYSTCSFKVGVKNGRIKSFEPDDSNKATAGGICVKGQSYKERQYSRDRIIYPMEKQADGSFQRISWERAVDRISERLCGLRNRFGAESVLFYESSGMSGLSNEISSMFWELYGGATTTYGNLCWPAGLEATRLTLGDNKHNTPWDLENAKLIILWGKNPAETNVHESVFIENAIEKGARLIVIDPRRTISAEKADILIQPKPGTDAALALALAKLLIDRGLANMDFISKYVIGYNEFAGSLDKYTIDYAEEVTSVPADAIVELAEIIGSISPMTIIPGYGMQRYSNGGQTIRCLLSIQIITGNIGKPGACWHYANLQSAVFDKTVEPESYYPTGKEQGRRTVSKAVLGEDMLKQKDPPLKMIWVERGNPLTQNPDTNAIMKAFRALEFRVVVDQFFTDTAMEADIVLPAKTMFEQSDIINSYWNPYIQYRQKIIEPPGEVKPEYEIYRLLAESMGFEKEFPRRSELDYWLEKKVLDVPGLDYRQLKEEGLVKLPFSEDVAYADMVFNTPSGKIELLSEKAAVLWNVDKLPGYIQAGEDRPGFYFITPNTRYRIHSQFGNLELIKQFEPEALLDMHPRDAVRLGLDNGDMVKVFNENGEFVIKLNVNAGIKKGCVSTPNGWWMSEGGGANLLTKGRETDMGHGTAFHDTIVHIEKSREEGR